MPGARVRFGIPPDGFVAMMDWTGEYKPGDMPPEGYNDWHEWARIQHKAGLRQTRCPGCGLWKYPQELTPGGCWKCKPAPKAELEPVPDSWASL